MPETPNSWLNDALAAKWDAIRQVRRVVTAALEVQRTAKVIGASLEAAPVVHVEDAGALAVLKSVDFAELCITSGIALTGDPAPDEAFRLPECRASAWCSKPPPGDKCERCWRILPDVGTHRHPGTCARCDAALG